MNDTASASPVRDYPPLPDFETVEQHIYGACRRYITQDMLEPIHNLIRDAIDADRAMRAQAAPASQDAATGLKDGDIAALVNRLRDIAIEYSGTQQLRERIASEIRPRAAGLVEARGGWNRAGKRPAAGGRPIMTTDTEALRAKFEAWFSNNPPHPIKRNVDGEYKYMPANSAWQTYQAGHADGVADERERCAQLCDKLSRRAGDAMDCRDAIRAGAKEPSDG